MTGSAKIQSNNKDAYQLGLARCPLVFLLKKGIKLLLRFLPEWGQELLCLYLITLSGEVIEPGDSLFTQRSFQSNRTLNPSLSSSLFPSTDLELYSSKDVLIVAGRGYHYTRRRRTFSESTFFLSFRLSSAPTGLAIGRAPGHLLNQFAMVSIRSDQRVL